MQSNYRQLGIHNTIVYWELENECSPQGRGVVQMVIGIMRVEKLSMSPEFVET